MVAPLMASAEDSHLASNEETFPVKTVCTTAAPIAATSTLVLASPPRCLTVRLGDVDAQNIQTLRALNLTLFPVRYTNAFYSDILRSHREYAKFGALDLVSPLSLDVDQVMTPC